MPNFRLYIKRGAEGSEQHWWWCVCACVCNSGWPNSSRPRGRAKTTVAHTRASVWGREKERAGPETPQVLYQPFIINSFITPHTSYMCCLQPGMCWCVCMCVCKHVHAYMHAHVQSPLQGLDPKAQKNSFNIG